MSLQDYGFVPFFAQQVSLDEIERDRVWRVTEVQRSRVTVTNGSEERSMPLTSSWHDAPPEARPTVGDWVVLGDEVPRVERVLDRKSVFRRVAAGEKTDIQLIAANIDVLFVVTSCNEEFKESRLERYLALAVEAGVIPVIVGVIYFVLQQWADIEAVIDPAGVLLLICLGVSMGFGFLVILRGARDL